MSEKPPCECIQKIDGRWTYRCECSNGGSAEYAASWVADENAQDEIARLTARVEKLEGALERIDRIEVYDEDARETLRAKLGVMRDIARSAITQEKREG